MTIDTEIRHVTKAGANLFLELGFSASEAKKLHAASRKQINDTRLLKQQLMAEISNWIAEHQLRQADAAQILMVSRPRVSDVVNQKTAKFTIDTTVTQAAQQLGVSRVTLSRVLNARAAISPEMALRLEAWLGVARGGEARLWLADQSAYDMWQAAQKFKAVPMRVQRAPMNT